MGGDPSPFAALGLEPGANAQSIDRAYKRLIKQYHPDREGGDARRAAEINRAYRDLRGGHGTDALEFHDHPPDAPRRRGWLVGSVALAAGLIGGLLIAEPARQSLTAAAPGFPLVSEIVADITPNAIDQPLNLAEIDGAARSAFRMARSQDEMAMAKVSATCHYKLRTEPSIVQLDRCAAFDDAVVLLQDRDPLRDQGPFSELSVTGRLWSGASALSGDYLAIDGRLDRIRLRVEMVLAPAGQPAV